MILSERMREAIRLTAQDSQAEAREKHADDPQALKSIGSIELMLEEMLVREFEGGYNNRMLAVAFQEALDAVQEQINANVPLTPETVLVVKNPYDS